MLLNVLENKQNVWKKQSNLKVEENRQNENPAIRLLTALK